MIPSPLRRRVMKAILDKMERPDPKALPADVLDLMLEAIAEATPAEVFEEATYLLGAHHLWPEVQSGKMTEHMCRRILAPDQVIRARMEQEIQTLVAALTRVAGEPEVGEGRCGTCFPIERYPDPKDQKFVVPGYECPEHEALAVLKRFR